MLGSVLEGIPAIVLFGPLLFPIARQVGVHDVHMQWSSFWRWELAFSPRRSGWLLRGMRDQPHQPRRRHETNHRYMVALLIGTLIVAAVPWISIGFL